MRISHLTAFGLVLLLQAGGAEAAFSTAGASTGCLPKIEGPIAATAQSRPYVPANARVSGVDVNAPPAGYVAEEYFISCTVKGTAYKTLINVMHPADPKGASGFVIVEPWHGGNNWAIYSKVKPYLARKGHAHVTVVARPSVMKNFIKTADAKRYATLSLPNDPITESEVLAQAGALLKSGGVKGLNARRVILAGHSSTGAATRRYIADEQGKAKFDGKSVYDGYFPAQGAVSEVGKNGLSARIPDIDVPVIELQGERELMIGFTRGATEIVYRRPDGPLYRLYEIPGMSHEPTRDYSEITIPTGDPATWVCERKERSSFPQREVFAAALDLLVRWIDTGKAAPHAPLIQVQADGRNVMRDAYGNAKGGWRTPGFEVPVATHYAIAGPYPVGKQNGARCDWIASDKPLDKAQLTKLYASHEDYVAKTDKSVDALVAGGWLLKDDAATFRAEARAAKVP